MWMRCLNWLLLGAISAGVVGCTAVGAVIQQTSGPARVDAKYVPPKEPTLILVENHRNPAAGQYDADEIAHAIAAEFKEHEVAPLVDLDKLAAVKDADPDKYRTMSITALAKAVSAKQVVYVNLMESGIDSDPSHLSIHGKATARVRIIDVDSGQTTWPLDSTTDGYELETEIPYTSEVDQATLTAMHTSMITNLSDSIAKLFYKWQPDTAREGGAAD